jgi:hypothetical protein
MDAGNGGGTHTQLKEYNLVATYADPTTAERAAGALRLRGLGDEAFSVASAASTPAVSEARMRDEMEGLAAGPGVIATKSMSAGAAAGAVVGLVVGAILGLVIGLVVFGGGSGSHVGEWATVIGFAVGLGVAGAVAGGFSKPRYRPETGDVPEDFEGAPRNAPPSPATEIVLEVSVDDPAEFALSEEVLEQSSPVRLDRLSRAGEVIGTEELGLDAPPVQPGSGRQVSEGRD